MCGQLPCDPMTPDCTWSAAHLWRCLARHVLAMPFEARRPWIDAFRGEKATLRAEVKKQHQLRKETN